MVKEYKNIKTLEYDIERTHEVLKKLIEINKDLNLLDKEYSVTTLTEMIMKDLEYLMILHYKMEKNIKW